ncbi:DUF6069 family protein [Amycolatopsis sp. NPDC051903]|uniref:DUF6069 family protein n=1 Tax=Amycolatopsis sp. NPDC051903 TaxID=3363936 RepID=UPI0037941A13
MSHNPYDQDVRPGIDAGRLWAGGIATAVVAALVAVVDLLIARGIFEVPVLAPKGEGIWGSANSTTYAVLAAVVALGATALMHLLSVTTPSPNQLFGWIMVLITLLGVVLPLTLSVGLDAKIATGAINLVIGLVIASVVSSMGTNARALYQHKHASRAGMPERQWHEPSPQNYYYDR